MTSDLELTDENNGNTRAKDVLPNMHRTQGQRNHPTTAATEWCHLPLRDVICSERVPFVAAKSGGSGLSLVTMTFDLDIQTHLSEGPNMSAL